MPSLSLCHNCLFTAIMDVYALDGGFAREFAAVDGAPGISLVSNIHYFIFNSIGFPVAEVKNKVVDVAC